MNWHTPSNLNTKFIAGFTFNEICDQSVCPRYKKGYDLSSLSEDTILFLNVDYFEVFLDLLYKSNFNKRFQLMTHNSDRDFTQEMFDKISPFVTKIFSVNCTASDEKIVKIPLGFNDQSTEILDTLNLEFEPKDELVYVNFKLHHHPERPICLEYFKSKDWVTVEPNLIPQDEYYKKAKNFKYSICPRGTGIDTHRIYESLLFGVIPVVKTCELDDLYKKFPIVIVDDWFQVTKEFLEENYDSNLEKYIDWKEKNTNWFLPKYWTNL